MGLGSSKEKAMLQEGRRMRDHLYARAEAYKNNNHRAFNDIDVNLKKKILRCSGLEIADMFDNKEITSEVVLQIFIERTINFGIKSNYVFDQMFEQALAQAVECDQQRARDQYKKKCWRPGMNAQQCYPPFYGVPASVKETILMKGRQTHAGFIAKVNPLSDKDGLFMIMIRKMGFISFARGNVSQACKTLETNNNIFGYCKNPWIPNRSCGGSSGGQSGMVSSNCAPIGFGSDIGGSLRVPAAFTGLVTLKPHNRYSRFGNAYYGKFTGGLPIKAELGVLSRTVADSILVNSFITNPDNYTDIPAEQRDPHQIYTPLRMDIINEKKSYKIGVVKRLKHAHCSRPNERAVDMAADILKQKGHELVEVDLGKIEKLYLFVVNLFTFDQELNIFKQFRRGQPLTVEYKIIELLSKIPWLIRRILIWLISKKQPRLAQMLKASRPMTGVQIFERIYEIQKIICPQIYKVFTSNHLDAVIMPSFATPAPRHGDVGKLQYFFAFTLGWNVMYYPVGVLPVTVVRPDQMQFNDTFNDFYTRNARHTLQQSAGLPVGVQVASTPYNEQKILRLMKEIQQEAKFHEKHRIPQ